MGVDPWADENDEHESRGGQGEYSDEGASELEREARRRREQVRADERSRASSAPAPTADSEARVFQALPRLSLTSVLSTDTPQFWNEGYREGVEEGKKATVQAGFNVGFREGATAGLAYGQARGAARSVRIFAGQVPGSSEWTSAVATTARLIEEMPPRDAARAAGEDAERARRDTCDAARGGDEKDADDTEKNGGETSATFAARVRAARDELAAAGFEHRTFKLEG